MLDYVPAAFKVIRHVRPSSPAAPARPSRRRRRRPCRSSAAGRPRAVGPCAGRQVLRSPAALPPVPRSTPARASSSTARPWPTGSGASAALLQPLIEALAAILGSARLHGDDTPVPVLEPGTGKTKTGRLWAYVRDERPPAARRRRRRSTSTRPTARASTRRPPEGLPRLPARRRLCRLQRPLRRRRGSPRPPAGPMSGASSSTSTPPTASPIAKEALDRIGELYGIEAEIRGRPPDHGDDAPDSEPARCSMR